jgi:hypothetical protein
MSLIVTNIAKTIIPNRRVVTASVAFDNSYPVGGEPVVPGAFGLENIDELFISDPAHEDYLLGYDRASGKLKAYHGGGTRKRLCSIYYAAQPQVTAEAADSITADQAACVGNAAITAEVAVAAGAWASGAITQPKIPRNVRFVIKNDSGGPLNGYQGTMRVTVTGSLRGQPQMEDIDLAMTVANKAIADGKFRWQDSVRCFDHIDSVVVDHAPADGLKMSLGIGTRYSFPNGLYSGAVADVVHAAQNETAETVDATTVDVANETFQFGAIAANDELQLVYWEKAGEVPDTYDLSDLTGVRLMVIGY